MQIQLRFCPGWKKETALDYNKRAVFQLDSALWRAVFVSSFCDGETQSAVSPTYQVPLQRPPPPPAAYDSGCTPGTLLPWPSSSPLERRRDKSDGDDDLISLIFRPSLFSSLFGEEARPRVEADGRARHFRNVFLGNLIFRSKRRATEEEERCNLLREKYSKNGGPLPARPSSYRSGPSSFFIMRSNQWPAQRKEKNGPAFFVRCAKRRPR